MDNYTAVGIAEGFIPCSDKKKIIKAWQTIKDRGLYRGLQGFFGRTVAQLTEQGILK